MVQPGFQDYSRLAAAVNVQYNSQRTSATLTVRALHRDGSALTYIFNNVSGSKNTLAVASTTPTVSVSVVAADKVETPTKLTHADDT